MIARTVEVPRARGPPRRSNKPGLAVAGRSVAAARGRCHGACIPREPRPCRYNAFVGIGERERPARVRRSFESLAVGNGSTSPGVDGRRLQMALESASEEEGGFYLGNGRFG